jgi:hypothetical protein
MAEAIPPSPYPVHPGGNKPAREIWGPYIASKPAYQIFADMAQKGMSISDFIAQDQQAQAKAEGRPDPVKELPENRKYWFHDGEMEILPHWPNPNDPKPAAEAAPAIPTKTIVPADDAPVADPAKTTAPVDAPAAVPSPMIPPTRSPIAPIATAPVASAPSPMLAPAPTSAPAEPAAPTAEQAAPPQAARVASVSRSRMPPRQVSHVQRALANASYAAPAAQQTTRPTRTAASRPTTRAV